MASDRARVSFDPARRWTGLVAQQGRVMIEADWNEAAAIDALDDRLTMLDVVGPLGTPDGGYAVSGAAASPPTSGTGALTVGPGVLYVGGVRLALDQPVVLDGSPQPDWLDQSTDTAWTAPAPPPSSPPASPPGPDNELVYLVAVEQEVSAREVNDLADVALGGPDTMQRLRVLQHFVRWPTASASCAEAWAEVQAAWQNVGLALDRETMLLQSTARLQVSFDPVPPSSGPCQPSATGGYLGPDNQLIRVQVASVDPDTGVPTIVWGFDDASFLYQLESAVPGSTGLVLTLVQSPVDSYHYPQNGQAVELLRDAAAVSPTDDGNGPFAYVASAAGFVTTVASAYDPTLRTVTVADQPSPDYLSASATPQLYLRVWEGRAEAPAGTVVELKTAEATTGLRVTLTSESGFHVGDYWCFAVRPSVPGLIYPARVAALDQPPDGPKVWACPIAFVAWDTGGAPAVSACVPPFDNLVDLTGHGYGCCTVRLTPDDLGRSSLADLVAAHRGETNLRICFQPGVYSLTAPLVIEKGYDGVSLEGCGPGVVIEGPTQPGPEFTLGLVVVEAAASVTISGIEFRMPRVPFRPQQQSFAALATTDPSNANRTLLEQFTRDLEVAIGVSATAARQLKVEDCAFSIQAPPQPAGGGAGLFSSAILGRDSMIGLEISRCTFDGLGLATAPFYGLATGQTTATSAQLTFGYLQVPSAQSASGGALSVLHDASMTDCVFQGLIIPTLAMGRLGDIRLSRNTVRDCYGGFWLVCMEDYSYGLAFDTLPVGDASLRSDFLNLGMVAIADPVIVIASAMVRVLPLTPPAPGILTLGQVLAEPPEATLASMAAGLKAFFGQAAASLSPAAGPGPGDGSSSPPSSPPTAGEAAVSAGDGLRSLPALNNLINAIGSQVPPVATADTGISITLRLDVNGCQADAVLAESYSGAALLVAEISSATGSVMVNGNRLRNRFPGGETALLVGTGDVAITGNIIANEIGKTEVLRGPGGESLSLVLREGATNLPAPPVAVVGNVLIDPMTVPARPAPLPAWQLLNTVTVYP